VSSEVEGPGFDSSASIFLPTSSEEARAMTSKFPHLPQNDYCFCNQVHTQNDFLQSGSHLLVTSAEQNPYNWQAGSLAVRNWPCNQIGTLCGQEQETLAHLCLHCVFAREVWALMSTWSGGLTWLGGLIRIPEDGLLVEEWWHQSLQHFPIAQRWNVAAPLMYSCTLRGMFPVSSNRRLLYNSKGSEDRVYPS
jgi:hypothetical protein